MMQLKPWKLEADDHTLLDLMPFLEAIYRANVPDVRNVVQSYEGQNIPVAFRYNAAHWHSESPAHPSAIASRLTCAVVLSLVCYAAFQKGS